MILDTKTPMAEIKSALGDDLPFVLEVEAQQLEVGQVPAVFDRYMEAVGTMTNSQLLTTFNRMFVIAQRVTSTLYDYRVGDVRPFRDLVFNAASHPRKERDPKELLAESQAIAAKYLNKG